LQCPFTFDRDADARRAGLADRDPRRRRVRLRGRRLGRGRSASSDDEPPLREDGSGNEVRIEGEAFLVVRMEPASGFDLTTGEGELVYTGPRRLSGSDAGTSVVHEVVRTGDFEAVLTWAIGLDERVGFRVSTLDNPSRLVVDLDTG
jgi:hypothetical protein